jgi:hypothetical protein
MRQGVYLCGDPEGVAKAIIRNPQGPGIWVRPEASRSNPRQGEVPHLRDGGPTEVLGSIRSRDLGIEVKCQSRLGIAGSYRNSPQASLAGDRSRGRALIMYYGLERDRYIVKLRTCGRLRRLEKGCWGKLCIRKGKNPARG